MLVLPRTIAGRLFPTERMMLQSIVTFSLNLVSTDHSHAFKPAMIVTFVVDVRCLLLCHLSIPAWQLNDDPT